MPSTFAAFDLADVVGHIYAWATDTPRLLRLLGTLAGCLEADGAHLQLRRMPQETLGERHGTRVDLASTECAEALWTLLADASRSAPAIAQTSHSSFQWTLGARFAWRDAEALLVVLRQPQSLPFDDASRQTLSQLVPHFSQAATLAARLEQQDAAARTASELFREIPAACLITDQAGRALESNYAFQTCVQAGALRVATGRVRFESTPMQQQWETALADTHATGVGRTVRIQRPGGNGYWKVVMRPWCPTQWQRMILVVFEERAAELQVDPGVLGAVTNRLTQAETEVLSGLLKGLPAKVIATQRNASVNTVRSQITTILEKTGFNSQKELIASFGASTFGESGFGDSITGCRANA